MEASSFDVEAYTFVEINPPNLQKIKEILVPQSLLLLDVLSTVVLKRQKGISALVGVTVNLDDFRIVDKKRPELIFAHAVASYHAEARENLPPLIDYRSNDQFFLIDPKPTGPPRSGQCNEVNKVVNLRTGAIGFVPTKCLVYYPHARVVEEFKWSTAGGKEIPNKAGEFLTIGLEVYDLNWAPDGQKINDKVTFGRNFSTRYSGLVRLKEIAELEPHELESWRQRTLVPALPKPSRQTRLEDYHDHPDHEPCPDCRERVDEVAEFRRNYQPMVPDNTFFW